MYLKLIPPFFSICFITGENQLTKKRGDRVFRHINILVIENFNTEWLLVVTEIRLNCEVTRIKFWNTLHFSSAFVSKPQDIMNSVVTFEIIILSCLIVKSDWFRRS